MADGGRGGPERSNRSGRAFYFGAVEKALAEAALPPKTDAAVDGRGFSLPALRRPPPT